MEPIPIADPYEPGPPDSTTPRPQKVDTLDYATERLADELQDFFEDPVLREALGKEVADEVGKIGFLKIIPNAFIRGTVEKGIDIGAKALVKLLRNVRK